MRRIKWVHKVHTWLWSHVVKLPSNVRLALIVMPQLRRNYARRETEIQQKLRQGQRLKVVFLVGNLAKWKSQSVYDAMGRSNCFEPLVALTVMDVEKHLARNRQETIFDEMRKYFDRIRVSHVDAYDLIAGKALPLKSLKPDIVFYQVPGGVAEIQSPVEVSNYALTCFIPYFVQNYGGLDMDCGGVLHRQVWRYFTLNEYWAKAFMEYQGFILRAGKVLGFGHPMLDLFSTKNTPKSNERIVIYAPHWSCGVGENFSTFMKNGEKIFELAKCHPELHWVFKPHPTLRHTLISNHLMTIEAVDAYYAAWADLGDVCYTGEYVDLFLKSCVLITDCASFLVEYACTGHPIIHLISSDRCYEPHPIAAGLFDTYYQAHNWNEFQECFERVVLNDDDFKHDLRMEAIKKMNLVIANAAQNIVNYLTREFGAKECVA